MLSGLRTASEATFSDSTNVRRSHRSAAETRKILVQATAELLVHHPIDEVTHRWIAQVTGMNHRSDVASQADVVTHRPRRVLSGLRHRFGRRDRGKEAPSPNLLTHGVTEIV